MTIAFLLVAVVGASQAFLFPSMGGGSCGCLPQLTLPSLPCICPPQPQQPCGCLPKPLPNSFALPMPPYNTGQSQQSYPTGAEPSYNAPPPTFNVPPLSMYEPHPSPSIYDSHAPPPSTYDTHPPLLAPPLPPVPPLPAVPPPPPPAPPVLPTPPPVIP